MSAGCWLGGSQEMRANFFAVQFAVLLNEISANRGTEQLNAIFKLRKGSIRRAATKRFFLC
jgi:hypothetical protein